MAIKLSVRTVTLAIFFLAFVTFLFVSMNMQVIDNPTTATLSRIDGEFANIDEESAAIRDNYYLYNEKYHDVRVGLSKGKPKKRKPYGMFFFPALVSLYPKHKYKVWFDAGCGECGIVKYLLKAGYDAYGSDISRSNLEAQCSSLLQSGSVTASSLHELPYESNKFDIVFSADVLEHIPEVEIPRVIKELVRVSKTGILFLSISQRLSSLDPDPPKQPLYHITLKPRSWWDQKFLEMGCRRNTALINKFQKRTSSLKTGRWKKKLRQPRTGREKWNELGEVEPWVFPYICKK